MSREHQAELDSGKRFAFGANWALFLQGLNEERIKLAEQSLCTMLGVTTLAGKRFIDVGSGSGLFSLAARRLGATVHSLDYDPASVGCTTELRRRYFPDDSAWKVEEGSALDETYIRSLGQWDVVYSWGVLHHTGQMYRGLENAASLVSPGGKLFIAIYNDQGRASRMWLRVKKAYNALPRPLRWLVLWPATAWLWGPATLRDILVGRPFYTWRNYARLSVRGMSAWRDVVDWVGGLPFEVAKPEEMFAFGRDRGFTLREMTTMAGNLGCNQFVFERTS